MAEPLCSLSGGDLREAPLAAILVEALRARATGELKIDASGGTSRVYLRSGQPCGAQIFFGFKPLGQFLLEMGWIDIEALDRSLAAVADGQKQGEALVQLGYLTAERLTMGLSLHHQRHVRTLAGLEEGHYAFLPTQKLPPWTEEIKISAHRAILDALAASPGQKIARKILDRLAASKGLRLRDGFQNFIPHFEFDAFEQRLTERLQRPKTVEQIMLLGPVTAEKALAIAAALYLMGVAIPATAEESTPGPSADAPPAEDRAKKLFESQERELEDMERQRRALEDDTRRRREDEQAEARRAREEALKKPPPEFKSDREEARARRSKLLQRGFGNIPGADIFRRHPGEPPHRPGSATPPPQHPPTPGPGAHSPGPHGASPGPAGHSPGPGRAVRHDGSTPEQERARFEKQIHEKHGTVAAEDHFGSLGLPWTASRDEIKRAFFQAAKVYHPDKLPNELVHLSPLLKDIFAAVNDAYQILQDDERRKAYLLELRRGRVAAGAAQEDEVKMDIARAEVYLRKRDFAAAEASYRKAAQATGRADLLAQAAWALFGDAARGGADKAKAELEQITRDNPSCSPAHYYLGVIAKLNGDLDAAERCFREAIRVNPKHLEANQELRLLEMRKHKPVRR